MNAIYSVWSKPKTAEPESFEILCAVLSALKWREKNGRTRLVCDLRSAAFIHEKKLEFAWDEISVQLDDIPKETDSSVFWAAGKIFALNSAVSPVVSIDTDFIVWDSLDFSSIKNPLAAIHTEKLTKECYPDYPDFLKLSEFDFSVLPVNTAFTYINNDDFLRLYCKTSIDFMLSAKPEKNPLAYMLFAEQRLFSMCADKLNLSIFTFSDADSLFSRKNKTFTHLWGAKRQLRSNPEMKKALCNRLKKRIIQDFPDISSLLSDL